MPDGTSLIFPLRFNAFEFALRCRASWQFYDFVGAQLRGDFGKEFRLLECRSAQDGVAPPEQECRGCGCPYEAVFNPGVQTRPFIFDPLDPHRVSYASGDVFRLRVTLVGRALDQLPRFLQVFEILGERGIGFDYKAGRGRFSLESVADGQGVPLPGGVIDGRSKVPSVGEAIIQERAAQLSTQRLYIHFVRPVQLSRDRHDTIPFSLLWDALASRLQLLTRQHCGAELRLPYGELSRLAARVRTIETDLRPFQQTRRSRETHQDVFADGLVGHVVYEGDLAPFHQMLAAGEWLHVGRHTVMGNGKYRLSPA